MENKKFRTLKKAPKVEENVEENIEECKTEYITKELRKGIADRLDGERIRINKTRKENNEKPYSKDEFAYFLGVSPSTFHDLTSISPQRGLKVETLYRIAKKCGCDVSYILGEYDDRIRTIKDICEQTGLSVKAIECLRESKGKIDIDFISFYIEKYLSRKVGERLDKIIDLEVEKRIFEELASADRKLKKRIKQVTEENTFKEFYNDNTTNWDKLLVYSFNLHEGIKKITNDFIEEEVKRK